MSSKLSSLPTVPNSANADLYYVVQGGLSKAIARQDMLRAAPFEPVEFLHGTSRAGLTGVGNFEVVLPALGTISMLTNGTPRIASDAAGNVYVLGDLGGFVSVQAGLGTIVVTALGAISLQPAVGQPVAIGYSPANPGDWVVPPTDLLAAVDRIARVVSALGTIPIP